MGRLGRCCLLISEDANHVRSIACEILAAQFTRRKEEHDALVEEGEANALFFLEVVDVLLELILIRVSLWNERNDTRYSKR